MQDPFFEKFEVALMAIMFVFGMGLFISGFIRFLNPLDTIVRFSFGGFVAFFSCGYLVRRYRRWKIIRRIYDD